jgi:hypothetical protein
LSVKQIARILIILLAAGIVSGIAYALVQSGLVAAAGPGPGRERDFAGFMAEGRLSGRGGSGQPPAALRGRFPEGGAFDRAGRGFADEDFRREGRGGVNLSARTWATWGKNLGIIAVIVLVVALVNRVVGRWRARPRPAALGSSTGAS